MRNKKNKRESDLYKPVARFFERQYGCKVTWTAGSGKDLSLPVGFGPCKPDVVAFTKGSPKEKVHLAEGKLLNIPTYGFDETVNQLDRFRHCADFLWAVFPADRWSSASANHDRWISQLRQKRYGLLLVDSRGANAEFEPLPNAGVDQTSRKTLLEALLGEDSDEPIPIQTLSTETAETARRAAIRVYELMSGPVRKIAGKTGRASKLEPPNIVPAKTFFLSASVWLDQCVIEGDPFSTYLKDGRALIWVWRLCGRLPADEKSVRAMISRLDPTDVYFASDDAAEGVRSCGTLRELCIESLKVGYSGGFFVGRVVPISDRSESVIAADIRQLLKWAREVA